MDKTKKLSLDIILRTHDFIDIHSSPNGRYCGTDKTTLICKCIQSLVNSANNYDGKIKFVWIDDHSSESSLDKIRDIFAKSKHNFTFIPMESRGWNASGYEQFEQARKSDADLVYLIEDDYLHFPTAIEEMVDSYLKFKKNLGMEIAIHPFDDPDNYLPKYIDECRIVLGKNRRFRTNTYSTFVFMCSPNIIRDNWSTFYTLATEYMTEWGEKNNIHEGTTINKLWRTSVKLFTPIPSLALHMGFEEQKDPYLNWKELWNTIY